MIELVIGDKTNLLAANSIIEQFKSLDINGTLYIGYPILASVDSNIFVDALLTSIEYGVIIFDFSSDSILKDKEVDRDKLRERQDDLHSSLYQKLIGYKPLRKRRDLAVDINVVTVLTCPPKTDPEVMLGSVHTGGRKDGKTHTIYTGADHHQIAGS